MDSYQKTRSWISTRFSNIVIIPKIKSTSNKFWCFFFFPFILRACRTPPPIECCDSGGGKTGQNKINKTQSKQRKMVFNQGTLSDSKTHGLWRARGPHCEDLCARLYNHRLMRKRSLIRQISLKSMWLYHEWVMGLEAWKCLCCIVVTQRYLILLKTRQTLFINAQQ